MAHLSKSDFKVAHTCPTKLWYKKHGYPTSTDQNEFMKLLANGGFIFGKLATLLFPEGVEIEGGMEEAIRTTEEKLATNENITLFEPAISINDQLVRVDILQKIGNFIKVIEVKSKSFDSIMAIQENNYWLKSTNKFKPYLEDIAFQTKVVKEKYPNAIVESYLMLPDKAIPTKYEDLINQFTIKDLPTKPNSKYRNVEVLFTGDSLILQSIRKAFKNDTLFVKLVPVNDQVSIVMNDVTQCTEVFKKSILNDEKIITPLSCDCKNCEYTITDKDHPISGFDSCWGALSKVEPHILSLGQLGNVNKRNLSNETRGAGEIGCIDELIQNKTVSLSDIPHELVKKRDGSAFYNNRPLYQLEQKLEIFLPELKTKINIAEYPLHFIDFETYNMCIPLHENMVAYENIMFQWSCHTITHPGAKPLHTEWLNTIDSFPNIKFAKSLKKQLGLEGTFLTWSSYENTQLKNIYNYLDGLNDPTLAELKDWLFKVVKFQKDGETKLLDMHDLAKKYYFHPLMGGRTSIKVTLPAVLNAANSKVIKALLEAEGLYGVDEEGKIINPYKLLTPIKINIGGEDFEFTENEEESDEEIAIREGGAAMTAYYDMIYGINKDKADVKALYENALKKYCKLDTLSMVCIWQHWVEITK
jgi:phage antirepressor YoqD-like protein